jgi:hypothetical protein
MFFGDPFEHFTNHGSRGGGGNRGGRRPGGASNADTTKLYETLGVSLFFLEGRPLLFWNFIWDWEVFASCLLELLNANSVLIFAYRSKRLPMDNKSKRHIANWLSSIIQTRVETNIPSKR